MPPKKKGNEENKLRRYRKWTGDELELFAIIIADEENLFAVNLEKCTFLVAISLFRIIFLFPIFTFLSLYKTFKIVVHLICSS